MKVLYRPHRHDLDAPVWYGPGSVIKCSCGAVFTGGNPGNAAYSSWRRIGWFGIGWRRLIGRISP